MISRVALNVLHLPIILQMLAALCISMPLAAQDPLSDPSANRDPVPTQVRARPYGPVIPSQMPQITREIDFSVPVTTLTDAIERAYWTNPSIEAARADARAADYRLVQARALYGPSVNYEIEYGYRSDRTELPNGATIQQSGWTVTAAAILNQPILTFGRLAANKRRSQAEIEFQNESLDAVSQQTIFAAISAYVGVIRDRNGLQISRDNFELLSRELSDTTKRYDLREATIADLQQVRTRYEFAAAQLLIARGDLETSEAQFVLVVGSVPGDLLPPNPLQMPASSRQDAMALALMRNPILRAAHARERISRADLASSAANRLPRIDFTGSAEFAPASPFEDSLRRDGLAARFVFSGPLFNSGLLAARQSEAQALNDADWRRIDQARRELTANVYSSWSRWQAQEDALDNFESAVGAAQAAYDGSSIRQRAGFSTTLDVLTLARELLTARTSLNSASASAYILQAQTMLAVGTLEINFLLPAQRAYDPDEHRAIVTRPLTLSPLTPLVEAIDDALYEKPDERPSRDPVE